MSQKEKIIIYTDGGSRGNPGPSAIGIVIQDADGHTIRSLGKAIGIGTNNEAEYQAVVFALQKAKAMLGGKKAKDTAVDMRMDSQLICRQLNGQYKIEQERLFPFFIKIWNLKMDFASVSFTHIPREKNRGADAQVNAALDDNAVQSSFAI
ncbi:MAG: ribonuclease HI family protein [Candidatus Sungiibacteriota bacterium]